MTAAASGLYFWSVSRVCVLARVVMFRDGVQTEAGRRSHRLTIVPTLYVAAGPIVWWYGSAVA